MVTALRTPRVGAKTRGKSEMGGFKEDELPAAIEEGDWREKHCALSPAGISQQNGYLLRRYRDFRRAADAVVAVCGPVQRWRRWR